MKNPSKEQLEAWRKDQNNWKCGVFYYNPEDERLLPPKKEAWMGWTTNFANSKSVALLIAIVFLILFLTAVLPKK
jgi:uncharacterized membrane protein